MESQENDDDEDVIIKGSPLYDYLAQNGLLGYASDDDDNEPVKETLDSQNLKSHFTNFWENICKKWPFHISSFPSYSASAKEKQHLGKVLFEMATNHQLLMRDDYVLLAKVLEDEETNSPICNTNGTTKSHMAPLRIFGALSVLAAASSCITWISIGREAMLPVSALTLMSGVLLSLSVIQMNPHRWLLKWWSSRLKSDYSELLLATRELLSLLHKCLHHIRETEVLDFGFTLQKLLDQKKKIVISHGHTSQAILCCPDLKKKLAFMMRDIFFHFSKATHDLKSFVPLPLDYDLDSFYLRHIPLEEFNIGLELDLSIPEQASKFEELYVSSLSSNLKTLFDLTLAQISEYLRRLCLCFFGDLSYPKAPSVHRIVTQCHQHLKGLIPKIRNWQSRAKVLHRVYATRYTHLPQSPRQAPISQSELANSIHITYLNLYSLLLRVLELEKMEEEARDSSELHLKMVEIKELFAQTPSLLEHVARSLPKGPQSEKDKETEHDNIPVPPPPPMPHISYIGPDTVPSIVDQVFVGTADRDENGGETSFLQETEFIQEGSQRRIFKDVFQELRSAIAVKAKEHRKREAKALAISQGLPLDVQEEEDNRVSEAESDGSSSPSDLETKCQGFSLSLKEELAKSRKRTPHEDDCIPRFEPPKLPTDFSSMIAAMAKQHSETMGLEEETFSDS